MVMPERKINLVCGYVLSAFSRRDLRATNNPSQLRTVACCIRISTSALWTRISVCVCHQHVESAYRILGGKPVGKRALEGRVLAYKGR